MGTMMALTSVNPVVNHCATAASTLISLMIDGNAGATTVWFNTVTKVPNTSTISMMICLRVRPQLAMSSSFPRASCSRKGARVCRRAHGAKAAFGLA